MLDDCINWLMDTIECISDCEYGDKSSGCEEIHSSTCYAGSNAETCCQTCHNFQTDNPGIVLCYPYQKIYLM